jgi:hypothetical protein
MRDNIMPLPYKEPSQVLMALLGMIVEEGRKFAGAAELQMSDMSANSPVGTTLAVLERTLKMMSAIQARIHYSMKQEFQLLKDIIRDFTPDEYEYDPDQGDRKAKKEDYDQVYVLPVSDPNAATMAQKVVQYQAALQLSQTAPQLYDLPILHRQMLEVLGIKNYQKLVPLSEDQIPTDPVSENQNILKGKPTKAFLYQDHVAHIQVHQAMMQDPHVQQLVGMNPQLAQQLQAAMSAHVMEHLGFEYRKQIETAMGTSLPAYVDPANDNSDIQVMPPQLESQIAQMAAKASQQLLQQHQQQAQQAQNAQTAQDPIIQMQQQELQLKQQDLQRKAAKDQADAGFKAQQIQIDQQRVSGQQRISAAQMAINHRNNEEQRAADLHAKGFQTAIDVHKHQSNLEHQQSMTSSDQGHQQNMAFNDKEHQMKIQAMQQNLQQRQAEKSAQPKPKSQKGE